MQFSVIVEGPSEGEPASEDSLLELERFLLASDISPQILKRLKQGQPQILKNRLSYDQAVSISDRLMDLGLESIIDPPTKPEANNAQKKAAKVTRLNPNNSDPKKHGSNKGLLAQTPKPNIKKPSLAVVKNSSDTKSLKKTLGAGEKKRPPMAKIAMPPATPKQAKPSTPLTTQKKAAATKQEKPQTNNQKNVSASSNLSKAAAEIKALFHLPKTGAIEITIPRSVRIKFILIATLSVAIPVVYSAIWLTLFYLSISFSIFLYATIASYSTALGVISAAIPTLLLSICFALTNLPLLPRNQKSTVRLALKAKDEPKLFMLATAIAKVFKAPAPTTITMDASAHTRAKQRCGLKNFLQLNKVLEGEIELSIGSVLIQNLSIRDFSALIAKEIGVYAHPQLRRPNWIIQYAINRVQQIKTPHPTFESALRGLNEKVKLGFIQSLLAKTAQVGAKLQALCCSYFEHAENLLKFSSGSVSPVSTKYLQAFLTEEENRDAIDELLETLLHIDANLELSLDDLLGDNSKTRLPENLAHYCQHLFEKNNESLSIGKDQPSTGLVRSTQAVRSLLDNTEAYAINLTRQYYQSCGLNLNNLELCSLKALIQQEAKDQKFKQAAVDYFGDWLHPLQFWRPPSESLLPSTDSDTIINRLNNCIARVRYVSPDRQNSLNRYDKLIQQLSELKAAKKVVASGNVFQYQRCVDSAQSLDKDLSVRKAQTKELQDELRQQNAIMGERLALGLLLDKQHKSYSAKLLQALHACSHVSDKVITLVCAIEELNQLLRHNPKNQAQQYQLYLRELTDLVRDTEKNIRRKLIHCPFDLIDRRYSNLAEFISSQQPEHDTLNMKREQLTLVRAKDTLAALNWGYKQINQRAAYIAAAMENSFGVDTIKKVDKQ